jgi:hypothetical protein
MLTEIGGVEFRVLHPSIERCVPISATRAASSAFRCVSNAAIASSFLRPNFDRRSQEAPYH